MGRGNVDQIIELSVKDEREAVGRLDAFLASEMAFSRSFLQKLIESGQVEVNGRRAKASYKVSSYDRITVRLPAPKPSGIVPEDIPLKIVYQDPDLVVIDKPAGLVVHPADGTPSGTLVNALLSLFPDIAGVGSEMRPGIVHRLDKDTSGLMVVARNESSYAFLSRQIEARKVNRRYVALVHGNIKEDKGIIDAPVGRHPQVRQKMAVGEFEGSRRAITNFEVLRRYGDYSLIDVAPVTGRTHQIRVHFDYIGHPLAGDQVYGPGRGSRDMSRQALHAYRLGLTHPSSGGYMEFDSPIPEDIMALLSRMGEQPEKVQKLLLNRRSAISGQLVSYQITGN
jgi:23S rRNA pseudouridine1911/1915/1917 synthase